jgi:exonuclease SbcC
VERSPAYTALKTRGEGTTEKAPQAALYRLVGTEREVIVSRTTEVTREVEGLVGLNAGQFRQVILLPQGKFAEVLRAKADEREALLKTLFDTVVFEQAGYWLEDKAKAARGEVAEQNRAQEVLRNQAAHEWSPYAPAPAEGEAEEDEEETQAGETVPTDQAGLDRLMEQIAAVVVGTENTLQQTTATLTTAQKAKAEIDKVADRWDRRTAAKAKLEALESQRDPIEDLKLQLATAVQAETLRTSVDADRAARAALTTLQGSIKRQLQAAIRARDDAQALPVSVVLLDLEALPSLEDLGGATSDLAARRAEVSELAKKALEATQVRKKAAEAAGLVSKAEADRASSTTAKATRQQERQTADDAYTKACSARDQLDGLQRAAQEARERAGAVGALPQAQKREGDAVTAKTSADAQVSKANAALVALRQRQIAGMAARLALGLEENTPCPVCGSLEHPAPAQPSEDAVSDEAITAAETVLATATNAAEKAAVVVAEAQAARKSLLEKAGDAANDPDAARTAARQSAEALAAAQALAKQVDSLEQAISQHDQDLQVLEAAIQAATTQIALQSQTAADEAQRAETLSAEIAKELGEGVDPQAVLKTFVPLEAALKALAGSCQGNASATARLEQASARLEKELSGSEFADAKAVEAALQDGPVRQQWAQLIQTFEKEVIELRGLLASADLADLPQERPDTAAAAEMVVSADAAKTAAVERHTQARRAQSEIQRLAGEHREGEASLAQKLERAQLLSAVADRCQGKAAPFISLQRWVLSAYLAEICCYANQRLELMTSGRYQLRLTDEGGRGGRNAGLGLRVLDAYTGEEREVSSLSGGETFQASLALALGVADTVQAHAGGVHLDALFIDEGFGTLDPDNLQLAMDELDRLREGGRMIGIISHVGALRERIRCGIEVVASDQGSRVCVGTPALL